MRNLEKGKSDIRKEKLRIRKQLSQKELIELNKAIFDNVAKFDDINLYDSFLLYSSYNNEVDTVKIADFLIDKRKDIYFPKVKGDYMDFYNVSEIDELEPGCMGILEPHDNICAIYCGNDNSLMFIPLSAFDRKGNRIGYGGGFYDKYLASHKEILKIGLAFSFQESDEIVPEDTDIKLDYIITDKEIIEVNNG